jgi:outer membrane protein assembly factor BamA
MTTRYLFPLALGLLAGSLTASAQDQPPTSPPPAEAPPANPAPLDTRPPKDPNDRPSFIPAPVLFYEPETGAAAGVTFLPTWRHGRDTTVRKSNGRIGGWYSQKKQLNLQISHTIFTRQERYLVSGDILYYDYPIYFYGVGNNTDIDNESEISYKLFVLQQRGLKRFRQHWFGGLTYRLTDARSIKADKPLDNKDDGINQLLLLDERQRQNTTISGLGPAIVHDSRDNILSTFHGNYLDVQALFNGKGLGSDYAFTRYTIDARHYQPLGSNRTIWASQVYGQFHSGAVPFRELANLGGISLLRGIYEGRFRDRQLIAAQTEIRHHLFWRINVAAFAGVGQVSRHVDTFGTDFNVAGGAGVRFQFNRRDRINIRFDYGVGSGGSSGLYFGVNEAF